MPTSAANFNFLALLVSEIKEGVRSFNVGLLAPYRTPYAENFMCPPSTWQGQTAC